MAQNYPWVFVLFMLIPVSAGIVALIACVMNIVFERSLYARAANVLLEPRRRSTSP